jgi:hypothetical protein
MNEGVLEWKERKGDFHVLLQKINKLLIFKILIDLKQILINFNCW